MEKCGDAGDNCCRDARDAQKFLGDARDAQKFLGGCRGYQVVDVGMDRGDTWDAAGIFFL